MDNKEIIEGNKLIATFMNHGGGEKDMYNNPVANYHSSWLWLMPVVEKIESKGYGVIIQQRTCYIQSHDTGSIISTAQFFDSKIETVFNAVLGFIGYYNNTQNKDNG